MVLPIAVWYDNLQQKQEIINWVVFSILLVSDLAVLIILKFKIDKLGFFTLVLHLAVSILRLSTPNYNVIFSPTYDKMSNFELSFGILIWVSIYNFTFELSNVKITLLDENNLRRKRNVFIMKCITISLMLTVSIFALISNYNRLEAVEGEIVYANINNIIICLWIKVCIDTFIEILFATQVIFLINYKKK